MANYQKQDESMFRFLLATGCFYWQPDKEEPYFVSCASSVHHFEKLLKEKYAEFYKATFRNLPAAMSHLDAATSLERIAKKSSAFSQKSLMHLILCHTLKHNKLSIIDTSYSQARLQQHWGGQITLRIAEEFLPALKTFLEAVSYGAFCLILLLSLMPKGWQVLYVL